MEKGKKRNAMAEEALKALNELEDKTGLENLIKDNMIAFKVDETEFRVKAPSQEIQDKINNYRRKEHMKLVDDETYLFRDQWIEKYKKKGIDIPEIDKKIGLIHDKVKNLLLKLAQSQDKQSIKTIEKEIEGLREEQFDLSARKADLLSYSIEDQLNIKTMNYMTFLVLEKKVEGKWVSAFDKFEQYNTCSDTRIINQAIYYLNYILYHV